MLITKDDFKNAGFVQIEDPEYLWEYDLSEQLGNFREEFKPALLYSAISSEFVVTDGEGTWIAINSQTPEEAVTWAKNIRIFE